MWPTIGIDAVNIYCDNAFYRIGFDNLFYDLYQGTAKNEDEINIYVFMGTSTMDICQHIAKEGVFDGSIIVCSEKTRMFISKMLDVSRCEFIISHTSIDGIKERIMTYISTKSPRHTQSKCVFTPPVMTRQEKTLLPYILSSDKRRILFKVLGVTQKNLSNHKRSIMRKLGVGNDVDLALVCKTYCHFMKDEGISVWSVIGRDRLIDDKNSIPPRVRTPKNESMLTYGVLMQPFEVDAKNLHQALLL